MTAASAPSRVRRRRSWPTRAGAIVLLGSCCGGFPLAVSAGATVTGVVTGSLVVAAGAAMALLVLRSRRH